MITVRFPDLGTVLDASGFLQALEKGPWTRETLSALGAAREETVRAWVVGEVEVEMEDLVVMLALRLPREAVDSQWSRVHQALRGTLEVPRLD